MRGIIDIAIGIAIPIFPLILTVMVNRGTTRSIGRNLSHILRKTLGPKLENKIELTLIDILIGAREDNPECTQALEIAGKEIATESMLMKTGRL